MTARSVVGMVRRMDFADKLHNTKLLRDSLKAALQLVIGDTVDEMFFESEVADMPKNFRSWDVRYWMDLAFMLTMRQENQKRLYVRYLQIDSSPQAHKDYLNIISCLIAKAVLGKLLAFAHQLECHPIVIAKATNAQ